MFSGSKTQTTLLYMATYMNGIAHATTADDIINTADYRKTPPLMPHTNIPAPAN